MDVSVQAAQFVLNVLLAVFTLSLFIQGQVDRRKVANDRKREQASKVSVYRRDLHQHKGPDSRVVTGTRVEIRNNSDSLITGVHVQHLTPGEWDYGLSAGAAWLKFRERTKGEIQFPEHSYDSGKRMGLSIPPGEKICYQGRPLEGETIQLFFVDGAGRGWIRRDGRLWYFPPEGSRLTVLGRIYEFSDRQWTRFLVGLPLRYATSRLRKTMPRVPLSARIVRHMYGLDICTFNSPPPWDLPQGDHFIPARDWLYQGWMAEIEWYMPPDDLAERAPSVMRKQVLREFRRGEKREVSGKKPGYWH